MKTLRDYLILLGASLVYAVSVCCFMFPHAFSFGGSFCGTDIIAVIISDRRPGVKVGRALLISDISIILLTFSFLGARSGVISGVGLVMKSILIDSIMKPLKMKKEQAS